MQKPLNHAHIFSFSCILPPSVTASGPVESSEPLPEPEPLHADTAGLAQDEQQLQTQPQGAKPNRSNPGKVPKWLKLPGGVGHAH